MNINESWHDDAPTSPFVNKEKRCAFKRPSYTGIPVLVSCIVLKGPLKCIASSVHGVLVRLGDGGVLDALSDSVEPSLLEELPLVSLEAVSVVSSVPVVDEESGLLSDVPLVSAALLSVDGPVSGTLS